MTGQCPTKACSHSREQGVSVDRELLAVSFGVRLSPTRESSGMAEDENAQKAAIARLYNRVAPVYGRLDPGIFAYFGRRLVEVVALSPGAHVLDVGAGRGACLFPAVQRVGRTGYVTGIDIAEQMVQETRADIQRQCIPNATMCKMDVEHLIFPDATFDAVLCSFAYFCFPNLPQALAEFFRVLRPQGQVAVSLRGGGDPRLQWYEDLLVAYSQTYHFSLAIASSGHWEPTRFVALLTAIGFWSDPYRS